MRLERFRIANFRSVEDSGWIELARTTAFVGRNESGKTNLLQSLASLNDSVPLRELSRMRDFPADRLHSDYSDALEVVHTTWLLDQTEQEALRQLLPDNPEISRVEVGRGYRGEHRVRFTGLPQPDLPVEILSQLLKRVQAVPVEPGAPPDPAWVRAFAAVRKAVERNSGDARLWAADVNRTLLGLQEPVQAGRMELDEESRAALAEISEQALQVANESESQSAARDWVVRHLPRFLYLDQYPDIDGHQNLTEFEQRQREGTPTPNDRYFAMLLQVSGIDPTRIEELLAEDPEMRRQIASRAGSVLTKALRRIWTDRPLKVRFNIDGDHFSTLVSDPTSLCDVEVNLNQRSRGFRWFFSFYVMFASGARDGSTRETILLLDEPGVHLHAMGQKDLLKHLNEDLSNQVVFATQSPFLLPEGEDSCIRTIFSTEESGTIARDESELESVMPLAYRPAPAATPSVEGVNAVEGAGAIVEAPAEPVISLSIDAPRALFLEDMTDYWYLQIASDCLEGQGRLGLPHGLALTPLGTAVSDPKLRAELDLTSGSHLVLTATRPVDVDEEATAHTIWVGQGFEEPWTDRLYLEDLLSPALYDRFVRFGYRQQLEGKDLQVDSALPTIVERYERGFEAVGLEFSRARPARLIMKGAMKNPDAIMTDASATRFGRLFDAIRARIAGLGS